MKLNRWQLKTNKIKNRNNNVLTIKLKIMEKLWKLGKVLAFILSLITFVYVGQIMSKNNRYQSVTSDRAVIIIDTQTGTVQYFNATDKIFHKVNFKYHTFD